MIDPRAGYDLPSVSACVSPELSLPVETRMSYQPGLKEGLGAVKLPRPATFGLDTALSTWDVLRVRVLSLGLAQL